MGRQTEYTKYDLRLSPTNISSANSVCTCGVPRKEQALRGRTLGFDGKLIITAVPATTGLLTVARILSCLSNTPVSMARAIETYISDVESKEWRRLQARSRLGLALSRTARPVEA